MNLENYKKKLEDNLEFQNAVKELEINFTVANAILSARLKKELSQSDLAKLAGTRQANISRIEAGLGNPTLHVLKKIFRALEISIFLSTERVHIVDFYHVTSENEINPANTSETEFFDKQATIINVSIFQPIDNISEMEIN